eukprot:TRINITY_DN254_c0_g3_i4.p1 TRINITY_DN254_c0_g3~~TRINITY_DN254_c0_g3_i4.p1  ORF type:complete len:287 (+),score=101.68 TRINITY_DN254_c0_g3_i4:80-940(+)
MVAASQLASGLFVAFASVASASQLRSSAASNVEHDKATEGLIRPLQYSHKLRVCNAYPYSSGLDVFKGDSDKLTKDAPMPYKGCQELDAQLKSGDKLEFKIGDASAGSFAVSSLPENDATLLLVVHRHDTKSTAVSFESHIFGNLASPQVAVIDTYRGSKQGSLKVQDEVTTVDKKDKKAKKMHHKRTEGLRYDSVIAVNMGKYDVELDDDEGKQVAKSPFVALNHESYVVLRVGVEAKDGEAYPEDVIVFPQSNPGQLPHSAASKMQGGIMAAMSALVAAVVAIV